MKAKSIPWAYSIIPASRMRMLSVRAGASWSDVSWVRVTGREGVETSRPVGVVMMGRWCREVWKPRAGWVGNGLANWNR